mmetsp:Transcript_15944/g.24668  ORF Transcript_15944/g.24668 Transcript_15944/m.24668 type:complete len:80 (+) Transcript_15944:1262-1501(+)
MTDEKKLFTFGSGIYGECGTGDLANVTTPKLINVPRKQVPKGQMPTDYIQVTDISAGGKHSMILAGDGRVFTFGFGDQG